MANNNLVCLSSISLSDPILDKKTARADVIVTDTNETESHFTLMNKYEHELQETHLPLIRLAFFMPLLNYGLFSKKITVHFPISNTDLSLLNDLNVIFSRDIFVNKIAQGTNPYILPKFFPDPKKITPTGNNMQQKSPPALLIIFYCPIFQSLGLNNHYEDIFRIYRIARAIRRHPFGITEERRNQHNSN